MVREHGKRARTPLAAFFNIPNLGFRICFEIRYSDFEFMERIWNGYEASLSWAQSHHRPTPTSTKVRVKVPIQDGNGGKSKSG